MWCAKCSIITVPLFQDVSKSTSKPEESVVEGKSLVIFCLVIMRDKSMVALVTARHSPGPPRLLHFLTHAQTSEQSIIGQLPAILQTFHLFDIAGAKAITLCLSSFFDVFVEALFGLQIISVACFWLSHAIRVLSFDDVWHIGDSLVLTLILLITTIVVFNPRPFGPEGVLSFPSCAAAAAVAHTLLATTPTWFNRLHS